MTVLCEQSQSLQSSKTPFGMDRTERLLKVNNTDLEALLMPLVPDELLRALLRHVFSGALSRHTAIGFTR